MLVQWNGCGLKSQSAVIVSPMTVYLDNNATTPPAPEVVEAVVEYMTRGFGNAASSHSVGRAAAARVRGAAESVGTLLGVAPNRIVWTSGATESLNTALRAAAETHPHLVATKTEHKAVLDVVATLASDGCAVTWVKCDEAGRLTPEGLRSVRPREPFVLAVMAANNETGVLNDVPALTDITHRAGGLVICDATQQAGKLPLDLGAWGVDYAAVSAHKLYGPQGVGALVVPHAAASRPLIYGGGHQRGWRSGTLNVPGIVGFGVAAGLALDALAEEAIRLTDLRDRLHVLLERELGPLPVNGGGVPRLPNTLNVRIPGVDADALVVNCTDVAFSSGSACTSAVPTPSHVLTAMGLTDLHAEQSVRFSLGRQTSRHDIERAAKSIIEGVERLRDLGGHV